MFDRQTKVTEAATSFIDVCAHVIGENFKRLATFESKASNKQAKFNAKTGFSNVTLQIRRFCMRFVWIVCFNFLNYLAFFFCSLLYFQIKFKFWIFCNPHIDIREFCDFILWWLFFCFSVTFR